MGGRNLADVSPLNTDRVPFGPRHRDDPTNHLYGTLAVAQRRLPWMGSWTVPVGDRLAAQPSLAVDELEVRVVLGPGTCWLRLGGQAAS